MNREKENREMSLQGTQDAIKVLIEAQVVAALKESPHNIEALIKAAFSEPVDRSTVQKRRIFVQQGDPIWITSSGRRCDMPPKARSLLWSGSSSPRSSNS